MTVSFARSLGWGLYSRIGLRAGLTSLLVFASAGSVRDAAALNETRTLSFHHTHSDENLTVTFKRNGRYDEDALKTLNHYLRDWRSQDQTTMDRHLFDILWEVYRDVDARQPIQIISSYRSPATNSMLRRRSSGVARFSQHMLGHAMDFYIPGVSLADIRAAGLRLQRGGVGFYPTSGSPFVHLDTGSIRHWPRMTHDQLARVFPNGRTVHVPSDGNPLSGYQLALADVQRRRGGDDSSSMPSAKSFLASLFSSKPADDEDEGSATDSVASGRQVADATPSKPAEAVPLPRLRPASPIQQASYQVASADSRPVKLAQLAGDAAPAAKPQSVTDIINSRGFWGDEPNAKAKPATAQQIAMLKARLAAIDPQSTASVTSDNRASDEIKPWTGEKVSENTARALAYAPAAVMFDRSQIVTASAPIPRSIRPVSASRNPMAVKPDTVVFKGVQPAPASDAKIPTTLTKLATAKTGNAAWLRAMILAPDAYNFMLPTVFGEQDMTQIRVQFVKPQTLLGMRLSNDPTPGLICERFTGSAVVTTASLR